MADLYSTFPGITVSDDEVGEAELIAVQVLQAKYPDIDLREGTGLRDLVIRPSATLMAMLQKALVFYFEQNTIKGINDDSPQEFLDKIMSNWFLERKAGSKAAINARLYFARQKDIVLPTDAFFSPDNTLKYFPIETISVPAAQLIFDSFNNEYYFDVDLVAELVGEQYNISTGSLLYFTNFDSFFLHAEINFLTDTAIETETNSEFIARAETAVSTRNLINNPSIISKMLDEFEALEGVTPIGMGDPEMIRDQIWSYVPALTPPTVLVHNGGMVDVYSRVSLKTGTVQYTTDANGKLQIGGAVYEFSRSQISGSEIDDTIPFYDVKAITSITRTSTTATVTTTASHGYTTGDSITIIGALPAGYNGTFTITVTGVQTFTYTVSSSLTTPATGTKTANKPVPYTASNFYTTTKTLTSLTRSGTVATATLVNHGVSANRWVTIAGASPAGYNGTVLVTSVPTADTFTYTVGSGLSTPATGTITVKATTPEKDYGFSDRSIQVVDYGMSYPTATASFQIKYFEDVDGLQNYLEDSSRRVLCADLLARGYNIYLLTVNITAYNSTAPDTTKCTDVVEEYLKGLEPGELFIMADLTAALNTAGIVTIKTPVEITYRYFHRDLIPVQTGTIIDYFDSNDRTAVFMLESLTTESESV